MVMISAAPRSDKNAPRSDQHASLPLPRPPAVSRLLSSVLNVAAEGYGPGDKWGPGTGGSDTGKGQDGHYPSGSGGDWPSGAGGQGSDGGQGKWPSGSGDKGKWPYGPSGGKGGKGDHGGWPSGAPSSQAALTSQDAGVGADGGVDR